ncbi:MAG: hypothetical protein IPK60_17845 [Sandaracinaceae bacterium]|nr:hypothetical protein [Sandaracinaceae bacterium]
MLTFRLAPGSSLFVRLALCSALCNVGCKNSPTATTDAGLRSDADEFSDAGVDLAFDSSDDAMVADTHRVLFVGNSYVYVNDVSGHYRDIAQAFLPDVDVQAVATGGYTLAEHAADANTNGTSLAACLGIESDATTQFDAVVLQEQSQLGGYPSSGFYSPERAASVAAAGALSAAARAHAATTVLYATWGYKNGDATDPFRTATYEAMQNELDASYMSLAAVLREQGSNVLVAPVGGAVRTVFNDVTAQGGDPLADGSDFALLYEADGSHPSVRGAYLAACILAGTITESSVTDFIDEPTLGSAVSGELRSACARTLAQTTWNAALVVRPDAHIVATDVAYERFGDTVSLTADATRLLVTTPTSSLIKGARVFVGGSSDWSEEVLWATSTGPGDLSADGRVAVHGLTLDTYLRDGTAWNAGMPVPDGNAPLALSEDGSRVVLSVHGGEVGAEEVAARVFVRTGDAWVEEAALLGSSGSWFSPSVAMDAGGVRAVVGEDPCRIFVRDESTWSEEATLPIARANAAISADGTRVLLGNTETNDTVMFVRDGSTWTEEASFHGSRSDNFFGSVVALSASGERAVIGAMTDAPAATGVMCGSALVYVLRDGVFRLDFVLAPPTAASRILDKFGTAVAMSADGMRIAVGAPDTDGSDSENSGAAYTFTLPY